MPPARGANFDLHGEYRELRPFVEEMKGDREAAGLTLAEVSRRCGISFAQEPGQQVDVNTNRVRVSALLPRNSTDSQLKGIALRSIGCSIWAVPFFCPEAKYWQVRVARTPGITTYDTQTVK